jgi:thiol-disulfide isomerase/thioredoxin
LNTWFRKFATRLGLVGLLIGMVGTANVSAAPRSVEAFGVGAWPALQASVKQPTVVVFTATWCASCPQVLEGLVAELSQRKIKANIVAVVMDVAPGEKDNTLIRNAHYKRVDRIFAFDGQAPAIRDRVDPKWRGAAPYVVLLSPNAPPRMSTGMPADADISAWAVAGR